MSSLGGILFEFVLEVAGDILLEGIGSLIKKSYRFFFPLPDKPLPKKRKIRFDFKR